MKVLIWVGYIFLLLKLLHTGIDYVREIRSDDMIKNVWFIIFPIIVGLYIGLPSLLYTIINTHTLTLNKDLQHKKVGVIFSIYILTSLLLFTKYSIDGLSFGILIILGIYLGTYLTQLFTTKYIT